MAHSDGRHQIVDANQMLEKVLSVLGKLGRSVLALLDVVLVVVVAGAGAAVDRLGIVRRHMILRVSEYLCNQKFFEVVVVAMLMMMMMIIDKMVAPRGKIGRTCLTFQQFLEVGICFAMLLLLL